MNTVTHNARKIIYYIIISLLFTASFCIFSSLFYPALNSDNAISVLMVHYFKLPNDLYFWGQDRLGSLIPLIGQIPYQLTGISALAAESITHYGILLIGFLAFSTFIRSLFYKTIFAIIWFFPPMHLIDGTQFYFGIHYSLIAVVCYLLNLSERERIKKNGLVYNVVLLAATIIIIAVVWVSDMALVSVIILIAILSFYYIRQNRLTGNVFRNPQLYYALGGILAGFLFIHYAKTNTGDKENYALLSDPESLIKTLIIFFTSVTDILLFKANETFTSVYAYLAIVILGFSWIVRHKVRMAGSTKKWALFFLLDAIILFMAIIATRWTFLNNVPRRYFTCTYIALSFALILYLDNLQLNKTGNFLLRLLLFITVLTGGAGTLYNLANIWPKSLTPMVKVVGEFQQLGKIGVISEYWNSYITSCTNPEMIKATPHDKTGAVRNYGIVNEVFQQKDIYVIKDMWLKSFPDTMTQFGRTLVKDGQEFIIGNCAVCKYIKIHEKEIRLTNPSAFSRPDEPVIIGRQYLDSIFNRDLSGKFPLLITLEGDTVASQTDDLNGDGKWDELFMLLNFTPLEQIDVRIILKDPSIKPAFIKRTDLRFARVIEPQKEYEELTHARRLKSTATELSSAAFQMEGPGWENDRIAFRNYFDARNGMDIYGKTTSKMVVDSIGISDNYHNMLWWGMDILKVGNSLGAGALAIREKDTLYRLDLPESGGYQPVANGPLRVIFRLTYSNWKVNGSNLDVMHEISIWGGLYGYQSNVTITGNTDGKELVTGMVNLESDTLYTGKKDSLYTIMYTHDNQAFNGEKLGMGLILPVSRFVGHAQAPEQGNGITQTYCARLKAEPGKPVVFRFYAGWEKSNPAFARKEDFGNYLESEALRWASPVVIGEKQRGEVEE